MEGKARGHTSRTKCHQITATGPAAPAMAGARRRLEAAGDFAGSAGSVKCGHLSFSFIVFLKFFLPQQVCCLYLHQFGPWCHFGDFVSKSAFRA